MTSLTNYIYRISFVYLQEAFNFASARKVVLIKAVVLMLFIVQHPQSCILLFLLDMLLKGVFLIECEVLFDLNNRN